uniref:G-protein coupled receptors family 1 profile domain-containing protein n=1 Tax=Maylandia zebra TaxID=106582 RepID=A0A3P9DTP0_9CICH
CEKTSKCITSRLDYSNWLLSGCLKNAVLIKWYSFPAISIFSVSFQVGLLLNGFIMKFYCCRVRQQASSSLMVYMKNLTAADFLLCLSLPLRITHYASSSLIIQQLYCTVGAYALFLNMYASILFMGYIRVRTAHIISVVTWVCLIIPAVTSNSLFFITQKHLNVTPRRCRPLFSSLVRLVQKIVHIFSVIIFLLVFISLVFFYNGISRRVLQAQQTQLASSGSEKLVKSRRNMLLLVSIFCVCFVPYHLFRLPYIFLSGNCSAVKVLYYLKEAATIVSVFNVCLDPVVYFFLCKTFQAQVNRSMASIRESQHSTNGQQSRYCYKFKY